MDIRIRQDQYEKLIDLVYLGNWLVNSFRLDERFAEYDNVTEFFLSFAPAFGLREKVDFDETEGRYYPSRRLEEELLGYVDEYDDAGFWDQLILRLAERDLVRQYGKEAVDGMDQREFEEKREAFVGKYQKEVENFGVDNLEIYKIS